MGITLDKEYIVLISIIDIGGEGTKKEVLDNISSKEYLLLYEEDLKEKDNRKELKWRNDLAFTRKGLQSKGYIDGAIKNNWKITDDGRSYLIELSTKVCEVEYKSTKLTKEAIERGYKYLNNIYSINNKTEKKYVDTTYENFPEGREKERLHKYKERNPKVIKEAKKIFKEKYCCLYCEVCGFNFEETYGEIGKNYIEGHHTKPVSELKEDDTTNVKDILLVCSNCHRMLHKKRPCLPKDELVKLIQLKKKVYL